MVKAHPVHLSRYGMKMKLICLPYFSIPIPEGIQIVQNLFRTLFQVNNIAIPFFMR